MICHQYYPYLKHLRWAFGRLPEPISELNAYFDMLSATSDWCKRLTMLETIYEAYKTFVVSKSIFRKWISIVLICTICAYIRIWVMPVGLKLGKIRIGGEA